MKIAYKTIQSYIAEPLPEIEKLVETIIFHAFEVESVEGSGDDAILDIKVLPDRARDCKEDRGMAREIAALCKLSLNEPDSYDKGASVVFSIVKVSELLGREITASEIQSIFDAYHYHYEINGDSVTLFVPPWRSDISHVADIVDEIGRYSGYESVQALLPETNKQTTLNEEFATILAKRKEFLDQGYNEVLTYALVKKGDFELSHAAKGKDHLRTNLLDGLRMSYELNKLNKDLLKNRGAKVFEIGKVFPATGEELRIAWIDEKGNAHEEILIPASASSYTLSGETSQFKPFSPWSPFPYITRDIAVWVPEGTDPKSLESLYKEESGDLLVREPILVDTFSKEGRTSYAYRLVFQSYERTLTDDDVAPITESITAKLTELGYKVR